MRLLGLSLLSLILFSLYARPVYFSEVVRADRVVVHKAKRLMALYDGPRIIRSYNIALGDNPVGHKIREGDERTPEGHYILDWRNPKSIAHLSIHVSYPNAEDRKRAERLGVDPGGMIMIHGQLNYLPPGTSIPSSVDWTDGCIGVTNAEMDEIWTLVADNTPIEIKP